MIKKCIYLALYNVIFYKAQCDDFKIVYIVKCLSQSSLLHIYNLT